MLACGDRIFIDESAAQDFIEKLRWPEGPSCIRCGSRNVIRLAGRTQAGMLFCRECRNKFTCRIGTAMEHSHIPLHQWLLALFLATMSGRRLSPQRLKRELGLGSYRTAWLMAQRILEAVFVYRRNVQMRMRRAELLDAASDEFERARASLTRELDFQDMASAVIASRTKLLKKRCIEPDAVVSHPTSLEIATYPYDQRAKSEVAPRSGTVCFGG